MEELGERSARSREDWVSIDRKGFLSPGSGEAPRRTTAQLGLMAKTRQNQIGKKGIVKLADLTYACNSLTNFEYKDAFTGNGNAEMM